MKLMNAQVKMLSVFMVAALLLVGGLFCTAAASNSVNNEPSETSEWARDEIALAHELYILPAGAYVGDLTRPITRYEFVRYAMYFLAAQYNMEIDDFITTIMAVRKISPDYSAFSDVEDGVVALANTLGIISGYGDGTFRPQSLITRQEAAKMLLDVYHCYAEQPEQLSKDVDYPFLDKIADWAAEAAKTMFNWNVMHGVGDNRFNPGGDYTVEQSIVTFHRLYQNAPVSRSSANIKPLLTFNESIADIESHFGFRVGGRFDLENYTVIYGVTTGVPHGPYNLLWIIYKGGGRRNVFYQTFNAQYTQSDGLGSGLQGILSDFLISPDENTLMFNRVIPGSDLVEKFRVDLKSAKLSLDE
ncbi:MAG: S-layer homology domain-containing protein [Oscillospiraceae bacterium]|nr:S-layer homology domain-containing protein [Oscillospiraceae bacterium]